MGAEHTKSLSSDQQTEKLSLYRKEMDGFAEFLKNKFFEKYYFNIVQAGDAFLVVNTKRRFNKVDRDGIEHEVASFKTQKEAEDFLEKYEKGNRDI
ncbi:MAG: hypothetical protein EXS48_02745 [Candidatus Staskawiczbacteria bacterium]|nr:hypothetical protein [Candidatus Staskawiczbacteria bacterium]